MSALPTDEQVSDSLTDERKRQSATFWTLSGISSLGAFVINGLQETPIGEDPTIMISLGWLLAFAFGALRRASFLHVGIAAMMGFPVWALVDLALHGGHTLIPFEFAIYAFYAGTGVVVALLGSLVGRLLGRRSE